MKIESIETSNVAQEGAEESMGLFYTCLENSPKKIRTLIG